MIKPALVEYLRAHAGLGALIGTGSAMRVFPQRATPMGTALPRINYSVTDEEHTNSLKGLSGLCRVSWQIDVWAMTEKEKDQVVEQVKLAAVSFRGTYAGTEVRSSYWEGARDMPREDPADGSESGEFHTVCEFNTWHHETQS